MAKLVLLFAVGLLVELWLLLQIGEQIGFWPTVGMAAGTAVLGAALAKHEGRRVLAGWREAMAAGRAPEEGITSGVLVLVGAALLIAPGVLTDVVGLLLLFPPTRRPIARAVRRWIERRATASGSAGGDDGGAQWNVRVIQFDGAPPGEWSASEPFPEPRGEVIDVEPERVEVIEGDAQDANPGPRRLLP